ncbi:MAG: hypothetical protein Q4F30_05655 [Akkermansia sp.]|nr:hypothetical protein [Akkermansia sp.]
MKASHLILLAFTALPLAAVEEAYGNTHSFCCMQRGMSSAQMEQTDADAALRLLCAPGGFSFNGEVLPATMERLRQIWNSGRGYGDRLEALHALRMLLNDTTFLHRRAKGTGLRRWRYTWGKDLPLAVDAAMDYIDARRSGDIPAPGEVGTRLRSLAADLSPDMLGFVPRSILAADPAATAWMPLWDDKASHRGIHAGHHHHLPGHKPARAGHVHRLRPV